MTVTVASLRASFPGIFDSSSFSDPVLDQAILQAIWENDPLTWPADLLLGSTNYSVYDRAISWRAGEIALRSIRQFAGSSTGGPGNISGMTTLVGSVTYDVSTASLSAIADIFRGEFEMLCRRTGPSIGISG